MLSNERASRQQVNFTKIDVSFSKGVEAEHRNQITLCLNIKEIQLHDKYLGLLTHVG